MGEQGWGVNGCVYMLYKNAGSTRKQPFPIFSSHTHVSFSLFKAPI